MSRYIVVAAGYLRQGTGVAEPEWSARMPLHGAEEDAAKTLCGLVIAAPLERFESMEFPHSFATQCTPCKTSAQSET